MNLSTGIKRTLLRVDKCKDDSIVYMSSVLVTSSKQQWQFVCSVFEEVLVLVVEGGWQFHHFTIALLQRPKSRTLDCCLPSIPAVTGVDLNNRLQGLHRVPRRLTFLIKWFFIMAQQYAAIWPSDHLRPPHKTWVEMSWWKTLFVPILYRAVPPVSILFIIYLLLILQSQNAIIYIKWSSTQQYTVSMILFGLIQMFLR